MKFISKLQDLIGETSILEHINTVENIKKYVSAEEMEDFVNSVRAIVQKEAVEAVKKNGGKGLVVMATGAGKSKVAIDLAQHYLEEESNMSVVVPTEKLRDSGWRDEMSLWGTEKLKNSFQNFCYASASKIKEQKFDLVILDECHNLTELSSKFFTQNQVTNFVGLTATLPTSEEKLEIFNQLGLKTVYQLTLDQAVRLGFVAPYKITVVYTDLDNSTKNIVAGGKLKSFMVTEAAQYNYLSEVIAGSSLGSSKYTSLLLKRMRFIYNLPSKIKAAKYILDNVISQEDRTLIFCGSVTVADQLCKDSFHSKNGDRAYEKFKSKEIDRLSCVKSINEGHSFPDLDSGLIVQVTSSDKDLVQRIGRLIRYRPGHEAHLYIIVAQGTQDVVWMQKSISGFNQNNIEHITLTKLKERYG